LLNTFGRTLCGELGKGGEKVASWTSEPRSPAEDGRSAIDLQTLGSGRCGGDGEPAWRTKLRAMAGRSSGGGPRPRYGGARRPPAECGRGCNEVRRLGGEGVDDPHPAWEQAGWRLIPGSVIWTGASRHCSVHMAWQSMPSFNTDVYHNIFKTVLQKSQSATTPQ